MKCDDENKQKITERQERQEQGGSSAAPTNCRASPCLVFGVRSLLGGETETRFPAFLLAFFCFFGFFVFFAPNMLGHPDNYIEANPMVTPEHIVPE